MKLYLVSDTAGPCTYAPTLGEAHGLALGPVFHKLHVRVYEVHVRTDQANLLRMLNGAGGFEESTGRAWALSAHGALIPIRPNPGIERWREAEA